MLFRTEDLLILRDQEINRQKYRIGIFCSGILEKSEDKMKNFNALFELMDERHNDTPNLFSVQNSDNVIVGGFQRYFAGIPNWADRFEDTTRYFYHRHFSFRIV